VIDIDESVWPQPFLQFFPCHNPARAFQQNGEDLKRLPAEFQFPVVFAQFSCLKVNFEGSETD